MADLTDGTGPLSDEQNTLIQSVLSSLKSQPETPTTLPSITEEANVVPPAPPVEPPAPVQDKGIPVPKYGDMAGAQNQVNKEESDLANTEKVQATTQYNADRAKDVRVNAVQDQYLRDLENTNVSHKLAIEKAHQTAAAETAAWMQSMDAAAAKKPSASNWWHNTSNFGKAMWLLSVGIGGYAQSKGGKNPAAEMIPNLINQDMQEQKEVIGRQMDVGRMKGQKLKEDQAERTADLRDDYTHQVGRLNALMAANTVRAQAATTDDLKAKYAAVDTNLHERKAAIAAKRMDNTVHERLQEVNQSHEDKRQLIHQDFETKMENVKFGHAKELAEEKIAASLMKGQKEKKPEMFDIPSQSGIKIRTTDETGKITEGNLSVPKDMARDAHTIAQSGQAKVVGLTSLKESIQKNGLPYGVLSNNNEGRQSLAALVDPMIKQMGGRFGPMAAKAMNDMILGEDPSSFWQRAKGMGKDDIIKLLDKEIQEAPGATRQALLTIPGTNLADNPKSELVFTAPDTRGPKEGEKTNDEKIQEATGTPAPVIKLTSPKDIKEFGADAEKTMPDALHSIIEDARAKLGGGFDKDKTKDIATQAYEAIDAWSAKHPTGEAEGATQHNNAMLLVEDAARQASKTADKLPGVIASIRAKSAVGFYGKSGADRSDVEEALTKAKLTVDTDTIKSIIDQIKSTNPLFKKKDVN